jgi:DivIVA domain-containing protein
MWLWVIVIVVVIGVVAVLAVGSDEAMVEAYDDRPDATLPAGRPLTAEDLAAVRFSTAVRGYRMDEVDALVNRLQADLLARPSPAEPVTVEEKRVLGEFDGRQATGSDKLDPPETGASAVTESP